MAQPKKVNYLNNKDILKEIHKSKLTYCWLADEKYGAFDIILEDVKKVNRISIKAARENKAAKMNYRWKIPKRKRSRTTAFDNL